MGMVNIMIMVNGIFGGILIKVKDELEGLYASR